MALQAAVCGGDSWALPQEKTFPAPNEEFVVTIVPKQLSSQLEYFSDKVDGRDDAGGAKGISNNWPVARISAAHPEGLTELATFHLVNEVAPVEALLSDDGQWLVTFDNWHSIGYGGDVVVIYRGDGSLVRSLALEDLLTPGDLEALPLTVSSRHWRAGARIDLNAGTLQLAVGTCLRWKDCDEPPGSLEIRLRDGELVGSKKDLLLQLAPRVSWGPLDSPEPLSPPTEKKCNLGTELPADERSLPLLPLEELNPVDTPLPSYTPIAKKIKIAGRVVLELSIAPSGKVACVATIKTLPMGLTEVSREAALRWRFSPLESAARAVVAIDFSMVEVLPQN